MLLSQRAASIKPSTGYQALTLEEQLEFANAVTSLPVTAVPEDLPIKWYSLLIRGEQELRALGRLREW